MARLGTATALAAENYSSYRIPGPCDGDLSSTLAALQTPVDFAEAMPEVDRETAGILLSYAARMASYAVRERSDAWIKYGLIAAQLALAGSDDRDVTVVLSLLFRAGELIDVNVIELFLNVARLAPTRGGTVQEFAEREPPFRSIEAMGFREGNDDFGFRFMPKPI